jgi:hypothetical protein
VRPIPIRDDVAATRPGWRRVVVGSPGTGDLTGDGSTPDKAEAIEVLRGIDGETGWPAYVERWTLEPGDLELLQAGGEIQLTMWVAQLVVHGMSVQPGPGGSGGSSQAAQMPTGGAE